MEQRKGADSLIAPRAKIASAGGILALAIASVLVVCGCGGDSATQTASTARSEGTTSTANTPSPTPSKEGSGSASSGPSASNRSDSDSSAPSEQGQSKHATRVQLPMGEREPEATPAQQAQTTVADIALSSPSLSSTAQGTASLPSEYTCEGKDSWPELRWQGVPRGSEELIVFAMNVQPVEGKLFFDWALAGLDPSLEGLEEGRLPKGAISGQNSFGKSGYSICPPQGGAETYVFALYALPKRLSPTKGFDPHELRDAALAQAGNAGLLAATYSRR